nr:MAG TPA: hypothetical protein [Bacteriophage sp.]
MACFLKFTTIQRKIHQHLYIIFFYSLIFFYFKSFVKKIGCMVVK